jgi:hypothetical protein
MEFSLIVYGNVDGETILEDILEFSHKIIITIWSNNYTHWYFLQGSENLHPHKNLHIDIISSSVNNCQDLKATNILFSPLMDELCYNQTMIYNVILRRHVSSSLEKIWRKLKCVVCERSQSEKATFRVYDTLEKAKLWRH